MARKDDKKSKYQGFKAAGDTAGEREVRLKRALKNAQAGSERPSNETFAAQDTAFRDLCDKAGVKPTARQASKFRNGYGLAARLNGSNRRVNPEA